MKILDTLIQRNPAQGVATLEGPTDGAKAQDVQNILSAMSGLFGEASAAVNSFTGAINNGKAEQKPVVPEVKALDPNAQGPAPSGRKMIWVLVAGAVVAVVVFAWRKR